MPKIEQYGAPKVETQVTPGARARNYQIAGVGDFAAGVNELGKGIQTMQEAADKAAAEEALVAFEREKNNLFFNPENGYFNTQGRNAMEGAEPMTKSLNELRDRYAKELKSPRAQSAFSRAADAHITRGTADIMRHAQTGAMAWEKATIESRVENTIENASLYYNDPEQIKVQNAVGRQSVIDAAKLEGIDGEALNERLQTYNSTFASSVIGAATAKSSDEGKAMLDEYGSWLEGPDRLKVEAAIEKREKIEKTERENTFAVTQADTLIQQYGEDPDARAKINDAVNEIEDPELRRATSKEATRQLDIKMKAQGEQRVAIQEEVEDFILKGGTATQYAAANPDKWEAMSAQQRRAMLSGEPVVTDYNTLNELLLLPPEKLAQVDPSQYSHVMSPSDRNRLTNAVGAARNRSPESQIGRTQAQQVKATVEQIYGTTPKGGYKGSKADQVNAFYAVVDAERVRREEEKGSTLTSTEYTTMLNEMTRDVVQKDKYLGFIDDRMELKDIPADELQQLSDYLHKNNVPVTGDNLIKAYIQASQ